jgi:hypothetical protein
VRRGRTTAGGSEGIDLGLSGEKNIASKKCPENKSALKE